MFCYYFFFLFDYLNTLRIKFSFIFFLFTGEFCYSNHDFFSYEALINLKFCFDFAKVRFLFFVKLCLLFLFQYFTELHRFKHIYMCIYWE